MVDDRLRNFLEEIHFGAVAAEMAGKASAIQYLTQLAAAQNDPARHELVNRMRRSVEVDGLKLKYGAYDFLLTP